MVYPYTPTYYTSLQDSMASICKTILPFSFKKRRLPAIEAAERRLSKQQSDSLKWQQDSFHHILNLIGLCKEDIVSQYEVSTFRTHLLETLIVSPIDHEPTLILRDKLIFLQELLYAKCISEEEYHASKRPLLQRLAVQEAEIDARDVIVGSQKETSNEEWSVIDLKDDKCSGNQNISTSKKNPKENPTVKKMRRATSVFGFVSPDKNKRSKENNIENPDGKSFHMENPFWNGHLNEKENDDSKSILMAESLPLVANVAAGKEHSLSDKVKKNQSTREKEACGGSEKEKLKSWPKTWVFDGFKKWKKNDETDLLPVHGKLNRESYDGGKLVIDPVGEGPDTKQIKRKLHPNGAPTDFSVDKVSGEKIKRELCRYPNVHISDDQIKVVSTRIPVENADLEKLFCKPQHGDIVLNSNAVEEQNNTSDDENLHPNLFAPQDDHSHCVKQASFSSSNNICTPAISSSIDKGFRYNPFSDM